jgi:glutathione synthase/RimK-type ligase-like ATP-grasp enzyme
MEVNANPGFATLEKVSGVNVAAAIVAAAVQRARCGQTNA